MKVHMKLYEEQLRSLGLFSTEDSEGKTSWWPTASSQGEHRYIRNRECCVTTPIHMLERGSLFTRGWGAVVPPYQSEFMSRAAPSQGLWRVTLEAGGDSSP